MMRKKCNVLLGTGSKEGRICLPRDTVLNCLFYLVHTSDDTSEVIKLV